MERDYVKNELLGMEVPDSDDEEFEEQLKNLSEKFEKMAMDSVEEQRLRPNVTDNWVSKYARKE